MRLAELSTLPGVLACALVGEDGLALEMSGELGEVLAAELAALRSGVERAGRRLSAGQVTRLAFTGETLEVVALFSGERAVGAALARGSDTRAAQQALARVGTELGAQLTAPGRGLPADRSPESGR